MATVIRQATVYAWEPAPANATLRQATVYAWTVPKPMLVFSKTALEMLYDKINLVSKVAVTPANLGIIDLNVNTDPDVRQNTTIRTKWIKDIEFEGTYDFHYSRVAIADVFPLRDTDPVVIQRGSETSTHQLINKVNTAYGFHIVPDDIVDLPITPYQQDIVFRGTTGGYLFLPGSEYVLKSPPLGKPTLASLVTQPNLSGFEPA